MKSFSRVRLLVTPWTAAYQAPPSMGFSRQEYWSGMPLPSPHHVLGTLKPNLNSFEPLLADHRCKAVPLTTASRELFARDLRMEVKYEEALGFWKDHSVESS